MRLSDIKYRVSFGINSDLHDYAALEDMPEDLRLRIALVDAAANDNGVTVLPGVGERSPSGVFAGAFVYEIYREKS